MTSNPNSDWALNAICPYFTMFPLSFPYSVLGRLARVGDWVLDPFCGRGTTNYAGRVLDMPSIGVDSNPVAVALSEAKIANTTPNRITRAMQEILCDVMHASAIPAGEFWTWAYHEDVLTVLSRLRQGLLQNCESDSRKALRAIVLGAMHGPRNKSIRSYFSNQCTRTYAPKPAYAVRYWKARKLKPERVDVSAIVADRAKRYYGKEMPRGRGAVVLGDSRDSGVYDQLDVGRQVQWVITSPPYYGMRTYIPDQWLRNWFMGGTDKVDYSTAGQLAHSSPHAFVSQLRKVWTNTARICHPRARLVVRFGAINDRNAEPLTLIKDSFRDSPWRIQTILSAGSAERGRRQSLHFLSHNRTALEEYDVWATLMG